MHGKLGHLLAALFVIEVRAAANGLTVIAAAGKRTSKELRRIDGIRKYCFSFLQINMQGL